jgi:protein phosphatase/serine/threonine-protein phosphatase Stp1
VSGTIRSWSASHPGTIRTQNQDACLCRPEIGLFAVADGVGGQGGGEIASGKVVAMLGAIPADLAPAERLAAVRSCLQSAHETLLKTAAETRAAVPPATTVVIVMTHEDHFVCLWAGDSRAYLLREQQLCPLTTDHSVVQELISSGVITEAEAARDPRQHIITRAVGAGGHELLVAKKAGQILPGDRFLLCSDGLYKTLETHHIAHVLTSAEDAAQQLVQEALAHGTRDNVTAVVAAPDP